MGYNVKFYTGDYPARQAAANHDEAVCYVEQHFNSVDDPAPNYAMVIAPKTASAKEIEWGKWLTLQISKEFGISDKGVVPGGFNGRGSGNIDKFNGPALLIEPCFISNKDGARMAFERADELAEILASSIRKFFPCPVGKTLTVAFSIGHKGKTSKPNDMGARSVLGPWEAALAEDVLRQAAELLEGPAAASVSDWAADAQKWVVDAGISDGTRPKDPATREEIWAMLHKALGKSSAEG